MNVLLLGDSHTHGPYGQALEALFKGAGHAVTRVGWVGVTAAGYLSGKYKTLKLGHTGDYESQAKGKSFDLAIISLGTNDAAGASTPAQSQKAAESIRALADTFTATSTYWVGPPAFSDNAARTYSKAFAKENLNAKVSRLWTAGTKLFGLQSLDSRAVTLPFAPTKEIHLGPKGGKAWADFVFAATTGKPVVETPSAPVDPDADVAAAPPVPKVEPATQLPWKLVIGVGGGLALLGLGLWWYKRRKAGPPALPVAGVSRYTGRRR